MTSKFLSILAILTLFAVPNYALAGDHGAATEEHNVVVDNHAVEANDHAVESEDHTPAAQPVSHPAPKKATGGKAHWGYSGAEGPENWGDLSIDYDMCKMGRKQSPINLKKDVHLIQNPLTAHYKEIAVDVVDNGHTLKQSIKGENIITYDGEDYTLLQFHYHTPSEHTVEGRSYPMAIHCVHQNKRGGYLVVGLFAEAGEENPEFAKIIEDHKLNLSGGSVSMDLNNLYKGSKEVYHYLGSFTTPPCTEGVEWFIVKNPIRLSNQQIKFLTNVHPENNRPVQDYLSYK